MKINLYPLNRKGVIAKFLFFCRKCDEETLHEFYYLVETETQEYLFIQTKCLKCETIKDWPLEQESIFYKEIEEGGDD